MKQSEMRFDYPPGHYSDYRSGGGRRGSHMMQKSMKKIELSKEPVELRKAENRWKRPQNADISLDEDEKETQVIIPYLLG